MLGVQHRYAVMIWCRLRNWRLVRGDAVKHDRGCPPLQRNSQDQQTHQRRADGPRHLQNSGRLGRQVSWKIYLGHVKGKKVHRAAHVEFWSSTAPMIFESALKCPHCGHVSVDVMPEDACIYFYECLFCHAMLRPKAGQCCVFCSYGSVPCPPVQASGSSCCGATAASHRP